MFWPASKPAGERTMNIFIAGASGAIGQPLIAALVRKGHSVTGITRSETAAQTLREMGATAVIVDVFDSAAVESALRQSQAEIVIDELTALPKDPRDMPAYQAGDRKVRLEGGGNLHRAARACGVRRYIQQSTGFFLHSGNGLADESERLAVDASPGVATSSQTYTALEDRVLGSMEGVALRYGFFYGPNTWYHPDGSAVDQVRAQQLPLIGDGEGLWNWVHIEDAALATVAALDCEPGIYHVVQDEPSPMREWLPAFCRFVGAPAPNRVSGDDALRLAGEDAVYYQTRLRGASNAKAKRVLDLKPRKLEWL
jgi:2-alkyl-3-oxoalkanoate reductase